MTASSWVTRFTPLAPSGGKVLDLACGGGRHGRVLLDHGCQVNFVDKDISGVDDLGEHSHAKLIERDLEDGKNWSFDPEVFDVIVVTNYLYRAHLKDMITSLKEGGLLLYETFARGNEKYGRPRSPDFLLCEGELLKLAQGKLQVVAYEHGIDGGKVVQRICAVKTDALQSLEG